VHPAHECFSTIMRYTNPRTHSLTHSLRRNRSTKCRQSTSRLRLGDNLKVGEDIWMSAAPTPGFGSRLSVHAVSHLQTWNWVTFCDPMMTRESSDPETQLTRWPCSIMNSKCRLMLQTNVCNGQEVSQFLSLFVVCTLLESKILKIMY